MHLEGEGTVKESAVKSKVLLPSSVFEEAQAEISRLQPLQENLKKALSTAPPGTIHIVNSDGRLFYYDRKVPKERSGEYISKKETQRISALLQKSYDEQALKEVDKLIKILHTLISKYPARLEKLNKIYESFPVKSRPLIKPIALSDEAYANAWSSYPYTGKSIPGDCFTFRTDKGDLVRSKSELNIANALFKSGVPYRYECPLQLNRQAVIYPDFTVLNKKRRKTYYWEHRGMMDTIEYARHAVKRIKDYHGAGHCLGKDLIITEETSTSPLGTDEIQRVIEEYFID